MINPNATRIKLKCLLLSNDIQDLCSSIAGLGSANIRSRGKCGNLNKKGFYNAEKEEHCKIVSIADNNSHTALEYKIIEDLDAEDHFSHVLSRARTIIES